MASTLKSIISLIDSDSFQSKLKVTKPKLFISHSKDDLKCVEAFVEMLRKMGLRPEHLFCSSIQGYDIPYGDNIKDYLLREFENYNPYVIYILSHNFYKTPFCLIVWTLSLGYQAILIPPFDFSNVDGAIDEKKISFKLNDVDKRKGRLNELKMQIISLLELPTLNETIWEDDRTKFLATVDRVIEESLS